MHLRRFSGRDLAETLVRLYHACMILHIASYSVVSTLSPFSLNGVRCDLEHATCMLELIFQDLRAWIFLV